MRILSAIQPTGQFHLGNYLGALKYWIKLQNEGNECFYPIVDLHALTTVHDAETLRANTQEAQIAMLAIGFDPAKSTLFLQSEVPQHTELAWILATLAPIGDLLGMIQFREKTGITGSIAPSGNPTTCNAITDSDLLGEEEIKKITKANAGLLTYPILMAADILLYKTEGVPIGEDQLQHLEFARTVARKFNSAYGELFVEPKPILQKETGRLLSLQDPTKKMSKSLGPQHYVGLFEEEDSIRNKIKRAVTDSDDKIKYDQGKKPAVSNLLAIYSGVTDRQIKDIENDFKGKGYAEFKDALAEEVIKHLRPIQSRYKELKENPAVAEHSFEVGAEKARKKAETMMEKIRKAVGIR